MDEQNDPLVPVRMLNEYAYCPRLFALEWLNGEWADSADTERGRRVHRNVDKESRDGLPAPEVERPAVARSLYLGDPGLGLVARLDLVDWDGEEAVPIDYKKGEPPAIPEGAWEPERVQICAQGLLLRAHGYRCTRGALWFDAARRRVEVPLTDALVAATRRYLVEARALAREARLPPPLVDSPKCPRCSLVGICLPDEQNQLTGQSAQVRPLLPPRDDGVPLYVQARGASLHLDHDEIVVRQAREEVGRARLEDTTRVVLLGNISVSTPLLWELAKRDVPVAFHGFGGWFNGTFASASGHNALTRIAQHRAAADPERALALAQSFVASKIRNSRVLLRRNGQDVPAGALAHLRDAAEEAGRARDLASLMGVEGAAARIYFEHLPLMLKGELRDRFKFDGRNRRPPKDPVNALLSFAYACLARELTTMIHGLGLDPYVGFLHQPRPGRPALALDLMEEFRPVVADSAVLGAINNGVVKPEDFVERSTGVALADHARKAFLEVYERRLDELATHPVFGTRLSCRRILEVQARLLGKVLLGELAAYPEYRIR
ncbi:MAG: CRISPR-associated endonuclease Cas1 [Pseudomonadota bacterium]